MSYSLDDFENMDYGQIRDALLTELSYRLYQKMRNATINELAYVTDDVLKVCNQLKEDCEE